MEEVTYHPLSVEHFEQLLVLANKVHGKNYLNEDELQNIYRDSHKNQVNASFVAFSKTQLVGFRLTIAAGNWQPDQWCTPHLLKVPSEQSCYFKSNTLDKAVRGRGIGPKLLGLSMQQARAQGAKAGVAHIWLDSPHNSASAYFSKSGGKLIKKHPNKWQQTSIQDGYICTICGAVCSCTAAEMIIYFD